jgi:hypothetical protein
MSHPSPLHKKEIEIFDFYVATIVVISADSDTNNSN